MAVKEFELSGIGKIRVQKRRGSRSMRIKLSQDGSVTVGIPNWVPYKLALDYAKKQSEWIIKNRVIKEQFSHGQKIGKIHTINFIEYDKKTPKVKILDQTICVYKPVNLTENDEQIQKAIEKGAKKALKKQTHLLEEEIYKIAENLGYKFDSLNYKFMKSKWGSCNSNKCITLNYRLLDLPKHLIEYVMVHELVHLNHLNHSSDFWNELSNILPDYKTRKLELKNIRLGW